jgi:2-octaprenyl-6-methoxyphenol hydroxylase
MSELSNSPNVDVAIVGGGLVGASLACALGMHGLSVHVLEAQAHGETLLPPSYDDRTVALSLGSRHILDAIGVWPLLAEATPIRHIHVSDRGHLGAARLDAASEGVNDLGYVVENRLLAQALQHRLKQLNTVSYESPVQVRGVQAKAGAATLTTARGVCRASLVVVADGGHSGLREQLGFVSKIHDYQQTAIIANVTSSHYQPGVAFERFTTDGPFALLPMSQRRYAMVWTVPSERVDALLALPDLAFLSAMQAQFGWRVGAFARVGRRHAFPLQLMTVREQVSPRVMLLGNSAHILHPIAGQGLNLCLRDVLVLADHLVAARRDARDVGNEAVLAAYARARQWDQRFSIGFTHGLAQVFGRKEVPVVCARDAGLMLFDSVGVARRALARHAMGLRGRMTRLFAV